MTTPEQMRTMAAILCEPRLGIHEDGKEEIKPWKTLFEQSIQAAATLEQIAAERVDRDAVLEEAAKLVEYRGQCAVAMILAEERIEEKKAYAWDALQHGIAIRALKSVPIADAPSQHNAAAAAAPSADQLRSLFDKTISAFSGSTVDYPERVNAALFRVYEFGRLHGRIDRSRRAQAAPNAAPGSGGQEDKTTLHSSPADERCPVAAPVAWMAHKGDRVLHFSVADGWRVEEVLTNAAPQGEGIEVETTALRVAPAVAAPSEAPTPK